MLLNPQFNLFIREYSIFRDICQSEIVQLHLIFLLIALVHTTAFQTTYIYEYYEDIIIEVLRVTKRAIGSCRFENVGGTIPYNNFNFHWAKNIDKQNNMKQAMNYMV